MEVKAKLNYLRIAPRKTRLVANLVRGKRVEQAQTILSFTVKKGAKPLLKLLNSAVANATNNFQLDLSNLYISKITVDEGPKYKRWMPRARGQASQIQKKTSHITLVLDEIKGVPKRKKAESKIEKPEKVEEPKEKKEIEKPKPRAELEKPKPKAPRGIRRIFRRKAF